MNEAVGKALSSDSQEIQNMLTQAVAEATKMLPKPQMPSWVEQASHFIETHPWISLLSALGIIFLITIIIRELICGYLKTNEIIDKLNKIEAQLKETGSKKA